LLGVSESDAGAGKAEDANWDGWVCGEAALWALAVTGMPTTSKQAIETVAVKFTDKRTGSPQFFLA
jgi:hypothetical protein